VAWTGAAGILPSRLADRLAACYGYDGWTKRAIIEKLIRDEERVALRRAGYWKGGKAAYRDGTLRMEMQTRRELLKEEQRAAAKELARWKAKMEAAERRRAKWCAQAEKARRQRAEELAREKAAEDARLEARYRAEGEARWRADWEERERKHLELEALCGHPLKRYH
jgi:hypothetical protein